MACKIKIVERLHYIEKRNNVSSLLARHFEDEVAKMQKKKDFARMFFHKTFLKLQAMARSGKYSITLPLRAVKMFDRRFVLEIKNNINLTKEDYKEIIAMANFVYKRFFRGYAEHYEDLISSGIIHLCQHIVNYDENKGSKTTYFFEILKHGMLRYIEKWYHLRRKNEENIIEISLYTPANEEGDTLICDLLPGEEFDFDGRINIDYIKKIVSEIVEKIPEPTAKGKMKYITKQKSIKLYLQCFSYSKVANTLGISKQCVEYWVSQFREVLKERLKKEGYIQ